MNKIFCTKGFLLLEVMISIAVMTAGLLFIVRPFMTAKTVVERSRELLAASALLDNRMRELEEAGAINEGAWQGDFSGNGQYRWSVESALVPGSGFNEVTVKVYRKASPLQPQCSAVTYINGKSDDNKKAT